MTGALLIAGAVAALLALAALAWRLRVGRGGRIASPEDAADAADELADFTTTAAVVGADGAGALAVGADGRVAVVRRLGARIAAREIGWAAVRSTPAGIVIETGERRFGRVALTGVDALDIRRLAPHYPRG